MEVMQVVFDSLIRLLLVVAVLLIPPAINTSYHIATDSVRASGYVRPAFAEQMQQLRPAILAAARRHNQPALSGMSDPEFATAMAQILYNEHVGWLEDALPPVRAITPFYQQAQVSLNQQYGLNSSVWPSNLRPSVAAEMVRGQLPIPGGTLNQPLVLTGSHLQGRIFDSERSFYQALNAEISQPELAVEYLAANLQRGVLRARYERVPVTWQTLAAWHNQGIVNPNDLATNPIVQHYLKRASAYRSTAEQLILRQNQ